MKIYEYYEDDRYFYIISELCKGGELFERIVDQIRLEENEAAEIMRQILSAVAYCHKNNIVHRDLKPENIIYATTDYNSALKIVDFGTSACFKENEVLSQKFGTPYYIAPEVIKKSYDNKCDIWSCGVILYVLLSGKPPFSGEDEKEIMAKVSLGVYKLEGPSWEGVSNEAKEFVCQLMTFDPKNRPDAETALSNHWLCFFKEANKVFINKKSAQLALDNLRKFRVKNKLQHAIWIFLVQNLSTDEEHKKLLELFESLDKDGNGMLNKEELIQGYQNMLNAADAAKAVERIMQIVDINKSGSIDYMEFVMASVNRKKLLSKKVLEKAFKMIDKVKRYPYLFVHLKLIKGWKWLYYEG